MTTIILSSGKCSWGKCIFCGWGKLSSDAKEQDVKRDFLRKLLNVRDGKVKIFSSGSFLDDNQFTPELRSWIISKIKEKGIKDVTVESRTEFVTPETLKEFEGLDLTIAIGLEVADDVILQKLNKGMTLKSFEYASELISKSGSKLRIYILVNPPFVDKPKETFLKTYEYAKRFSNSIIALNCYPHSKSELFDLWISGKWKPLDKKQFEDVLKGLDIENDFNNYSFVPKFQNDKREQIDGVSSKNLNHPHFEVWQDYLVRFYERSGEKVFALFLPCSFKKPYHTSPTHKMIMSALFKLKDYKKIHQIMISTPGVIPREFENEYPFNSYEWNDKDETPEIKKEYILVNKQRISNYLNSKQYEKVFSYLKPESESYKALKLACDELGINLISLIDETIYTSLDKTQPRILTDPSLLEKMKTKMLEHLST